MKKLLCIFGAVAAAGWLGLLPFEATDVAELIPAQTVFIMKDGTQYTVDIGEGVQAVGTTLQQALGMLQEQTAGTVFFETCEQVVLMGDTEQLLPELAQQEAFRPAAGVYRVSQKPKIDELTSYLNTHHGDVTVSKIKAAVAAGETIRVPYIVSAGGGFRLLA